LANVLRMQHRTVTIREPDGTLRFANPEERERVLHVYFPQPGKMPKIPAMFEESRLEVNFAFYYVL
jgi:small subunit ribosomal protein S22